MNSTLGLPETNLGGVSVPITFIPSIILLNPVSADYVAHASVQVAPWIMGAFADLFLQGILMAQTTSYFTFNDGTNSRRRFTFLVIILQSLCLVKTAQNIGIVWNTVVTNFANPDVASFLVIASWLHYTTSLSTAVIATYVQSFFVYRYYMLTKRFWLCLPLIGGMIVSLVGAVFVIVIIPTFNNPKVRFWSDVHFTAAVIVDTAIVVLTSVHLYNRKTSIKNTSDIVDRLIRMTWQSALPPAVMVILNLVVLELRPFELSHIALNMVAAKLYAIALMYTLNLRNEIRGTRMTEHPVSQGGGTINRPLKKSFANPSGSMFGNGRQQQSRLDGIHVETQIMSNAPLDERYIDIGRFQNPNNLGVKKQNSWEGDEKFYAVR